MAKTRYVVKYNYELLREEWKEWLVATAICVGITAAVLVVVGYLLSEGNYIH